MIVNTAYIYMGSAGGPVNPVIFQGNEINYNYSGTNFTETTEGFKMTGASELVFTGLDLSNFENLAIQARNGASSKVYLTINFIDNSGKVSADIKTNFGDHSTQSYTFTIPAEYRKPKTKIKFSKSGPRSITLQYANLS